MAENDINESNIFKELSWELDFWNVWDWELDSKLVEIKDANYYLRLTSKILLYVNLLFIFIIFVLFLYVKIQKNETLLENSSINPICSILLWSEISSHESTDCSSVYALSNKYKASVNSLVDEQTKKIIDIIPNLVTVKNFTLSKDVKFLLNKTQNRLKPLIILEEFDKIKNKFASWDKWQIKCSGISINSDNLLSISCTAYTSDWNSKIPTFEAWKFVSWTSISLASNFVNYIEKEWESFEIINKPKSFSLEDYSWNWYYTKKTDFNLNLKYRNNNITNF